MQDLRQSPQYAKYLRLIGWKSEKHGSDFIYIKEVPIIGSFVKIQRPLQPLGKKEVEKLRRKHRVFAISIEPSDNGQKEELISLGFKNSKIPSLPTRTIRINLSKSEKTILKQMHSKSRYNIGLAKRKRVEIRKSKNVEEYASFWQKNARKRQLFLSLEREIISIYNSFGKNAMIINAYKDHELLGGILLISYKGTTYYMYATSNLKGKRLHAPTLLVWESLVYAKKMGSKYFDFEGIYDERYPLETWKGFSKFKRTFGGDILEFPGPMLKYFIPIKI